MNFPRCSLIRLRGFRLPTIGLCLVVSQENARASTITRGDVTTALGPSFFFDNTSIGGGDDSVIAQPAVRTYARNFSGLLSPNQGPTRVMLTGFGFAGQNTASDNTATTLTFTFTYLGADEAVGGGDDVVMGSAAGTYQFASEGEYGFAFTTPMVAELNITGVRFLIQVAPSNATGNGRVRFKTGALTYETASSAKFSVAGSATLPPQRVNLAKYQPVTTSSVNGQRLATYVTDGIVGNDNRWESSGSGSQWARVDFPFPVEVGSAQVFTGVDDANATGQFYIQYLNGSTWVTIPGGGAPGNTNPERNIVFTTPTTASAFRFLSSTGTAYLRELALYPPNGGAGYAVGTDLTLNLAHKRPTTSTSLTAGNFALLATDGRSNQNSKWQTNVAGSNELEIDLRVTTKIGSAHLYSGSSGVAPLGDFTLQYLSGSTWLDVPGATVAGNTSADRVISFTTPVTTSRVKLVFTNVGTTSVRELCIFPANSGNAGYPLGTGVTLAAPPSGKFDDYSDAFHLIRNTSANLSIAASNSSTSLGPGLTTAQGQYQILFNHENGSYRLRNRATAWCLSGAQLSTTPGAPLVDAPYAALPDQDWVLTTASGGNFHLVNCWSGLALDTQGGGTAVGTAVVQNVHIGASSQRWQFVDSEIFPKKGIGGANFATPFNANWVYNWGLQNGVSLPPGAVYNPMQWGNFNWNWNATQSTNWRLYAGWRTASESLHLMGFNEPDVFSQSGDSLDTGSSSEATFSTTRSLENAVTFWPRLMAMDQPLVSPAPANMNNNWLNSFYSQADTLGYRVDYTALHTYPGPSSGSANNLISFLQTYFNAWDRPVWLTEFSFVDWSRNSSWTEEDCYNTLAEFLWRAESVPWLRKYALFVFTESATNPQPDTPWSTSVSTGGAPRSNARDINGKLTAFGKLYAGWDNDAVVRTDKTYYIHNRNTRKRLANLLASSPDAQSIRVDEDSVKWTLETASAANRYYLVSGIDGRRLSYNGTNITLAAANTTGPAVEWSLTQKEYGWFFIGHPGNSGQRLRLNYDNATLTASFGMVASSSAGDDVAWRFIIPPPTPTWAGSVSNSWTVAANWTPGIVPGATDSVKFDSSSTANPNTVLNQDFTLSGVTVLDPSANVSIGGTHTLTLGAGGINLSAATSNLAINAPVDLGSNQTWTVGSTRTLTLGGAISGSFDLTLAGTGRVALGADNLLPTGAGVGNLVVNGTLDLNNTAQSIANLSGTGTVDNTGGGAAALTIGSSNAAITLSSPALQNTNGTLALIKVGSGSLILPSANTFSGGLTNNGTGNIIPQHNSAFGAGSVVMNGGTIYPVTTRTFSNLLTLNGSNLRIGGGNSRTINWTGTVTISGNSSIQCDDGTSGINLSGGVNMLDGTLSSAPNNTTNVISAPITGTGTISANHASGTLHLGAPNTFGGTYRAALGTLRIGNALALQDGTLDLRASDSGTVNLNNLGANLGALTGSRNLALGSSTVSIGNNNSSTTYSGVLSGSGSLVKIGIGTLTLGGANNYDGGTTIRSGTLALGASNVLPNTNLTIDNATLDAATFSDTLGALALTSSASIQLGQAATLIFANSSAADWSGGTLNIIGTFVPGVSMRFGTNSSGLTASQLSLVSSPGFTSFALDSNGFLTTANNVVPYDAWKSQITNGMNLRSQDADGDGSTNHQEFLFGTSPLVPAGSLVAVSPVGNTSLVLRWLQRENGATYTLQQSATLAAEFWIPATELPVLDPNQSGAPADYDFHTVTLPTSAGTRFFRIKAEEN